MHRDEIAGCSEKAYDSLSLADAKKILMFASDRDLQAYVLDVSIRLGFCSKLFSHKYVVILYISHIIDFCHCFC